MELPRVDLDHGLGHLAVQPEVVDAALADLPDADSFVVPDLVVAHHSEDELEDLVLHPLDDHIDQVGLQLAVLRGELVDRDERLVHVGPHVAGQVAQLVRHAPDVVVGALVRPPVRTELVARVPLGGEVELPDDAAPCRVQDVQELLLVEEKLVELDLAEDELVVLLPCRRAVHVSLAQVSHRASRIV